MSCRPLRITSCPPRFGQEDRSRSRSGLLAFPRPDFTSRVARHMLHCVADQPRTHRLIHWSANPPKLSPLTLLLDSTSGQTGQFLDPCAISRDATECLRVAVVWMGSNSVFSMVTWDQIVQMVTILAILQSILTVNWRGYNATCRNASKCTDFNLKFPKKFPGPKRGTEPLPI